MITCKQVATLLMSGELKRRSLWRRMEVRVHLWMCKHCSLLARQMEQIRQAGQRLRSTFDSEKLAGVPDSLEARLLTKLQSPPPADQHER